MSRTFLIQNGDWVVSAQTGRHQLVADAAKVRQDIRENLSVATQPSGFGAGIDQLLGQVFDPINFRVLLARNIRLSIQAMQALQDQFQPQQRPLAERIRGITALQVFLLNGATDFAFQLQVSTLAAGPQITASGQGTLLLTASSAAMTGGS